MKNQRLKILTLVVLGWCHYLLPADTNKEYKELQLISAAKTGDLEEFKKLLQEGVNIDATNLNQHNAWTIACYAGELPIVGYLHQDKGFDINYRFNSSSDNDALAGSSGAMLAIMKGHYHIVQYLMDKGIDVTYKNKKGEDLMMILVRKSSARDNNIQPLMTHIIKETNNPTITNEHYKLLLRAAIYHSNKELVQYLIEKKNIDINDFLNLEIPDSALTRRLKGHPFLIALDKFGRNQNDVETLFYLFEQKPDLTKKESKGVDGILILFEKFNWDIIEMVWERLVAYNNMSKEHFHLYLRKAIISYQPLAIIKKIVEKYNIKISEPFDPSTLYPDVNENDFLKKMSASPISLLLSKGWNSRKEEENNKLLQYFLEQGSDLKGIVNHNGRDVITTIVLKKSWNVLNYMLNSEDHSKKMNPNHCKLLLRVAARYGKLDLVKKVVEEKGISPSEPLEEGVLSIPTHYRWNPIFLVLAKSDNQPDENRVVKYLVAQLGNISNIQDNEGVSLMIRLLEKKKWNIIEDIIKDSQYDNMVSNEDYQVMLRAAIYEKKKGIVQYLVETKEVPLNQPISSETKSTIPVYWHDKAVMIALKLEEDPDGLLNYLISKDGELDFSHVEHGSPIVVAVQSSNNHLLNKIIGMQCEIHPFYKQLILNYAIKARKLAMVKKIITKGAKVNDSLDTTDFTGNIRTLEGSPILQATRAKSKQIMKFLLANGAIIDISEDPENDALLVAAREGLKFIMEIFVKYKNQLELDQGDIESAIVEARKERKYRMVRYLKTVKLDDDSLPSDQLPDLTQAGGSHGTSSQATGDTVSKKDKLIFIVSIVGLCIGIIVAAISGYTYFSRRKKE